MMCLKSIRKQRIAFVQLPQRTRYYSFSGSIGRSTIRPSWKFIRKGILNYSEYSMLSASRMCSQRKKVSRRRTQRNYPKAFSVYLLLMVVYGFFLPFRSTQLCDPRRMIYSIRLNSQEYFMARKLRPMSKWPRPMETSSQEMSTLSPRLPMAMPWMYARLSSTLMSRNMWRTLILDSSSRVFLDISLSNLVLSDFYSTLQVLLSILLMPYQNFYSYTSREQNFSLSCVDSSLSLFRDCVNSSSSLCSSLISSSSCLSALSLLPSEDFLMSSLSSKEDSNSLQQMNRSSSVLASCISSCICVSRHLAQQATSSSILMIASSFSSSNMTSSTDAQEQKRWHLLHSTRYYFYVGWPSTLS